MNVSAHSLREIITHHLGAKQVARLADLRDAWSKGATE